MDDYKDRTEMNMDDAPDTPAPVFVARALSRFIFGTPKPSDSESIQRLPRRTMSASRLQAGKPKSPTTRRDDVEGPSTPKASTQARSPAKRPGILLTPGTGGTRRKTVSFDAVTSRPSILSIDGSSERVTFRSRLDTLNPVARTNNALGSIPQVTANPVASADILPLPSATVTRDTTAEDNITIDLLAPRSTSGQYWKKEYESYTSKSETEMKKLLKKEKLAKKYAKHMDDEVVDLTNEVAALKSSLSSANNKIDELQSRNQSLEAELDALKAGLHSDKREAPQAIQHHRQSPRSRQSVAQGPTTNQRSHESVEDSQAHMSSDIWADIGTGEPRVARTQSPEKNDTPLRPTSLNIIRKEDHQCSIEKKMSNERRAAALRRLEERRRNREKGGGIGQ